MVKEICLIKAEAEKSRDMKIRLEELPGIKEVLQLFGDYDLIRSIKGIKETNTLIAAET